MNCKPGELAIQIGCEGGWSKYVGSIVECVSFYTNHEGVVIWRVNPSTPSDPGVIDEVLDKNLRPIRDPGDDATDEMVLIAGKPQEVTA